MKEKSTGQKELLKYEVGQEMGIVNKSKKQEKKKDIKK